MATFTFLKMENSLIRYFLFITFVSGMIIFMWNYQIPVNQNNMIVDEKTVEVFSKDLNTEIIPKDLKYILLWTQSDFHPFYLFKNGQTAFIERNCSVFSCYATSNRTLFEGDITTFDAIAFNGRNIEKSLKDLPIMRSMNQKYIYINFESADNYPVCSKTFDDFFNWTLTYRLDSDIPTPYIQIESIMGEVIGPKQKMEWMKYVQEINFNESSNRHNKSKAVAWFVSNCFTRNGRENYASQLNQTLFYYGLEVDIYGTCGDLKCPRFAERDCDRILERDYYFYLSFENSFAEDYVTEKVLTALQNNVVPIILGGANYSRFLPPGSYIDANKLSPNQLATILNHLIRSPKDYSKYFRWKTYYKYKKRSYDDIVCSVCAALHNKTFYGKRQYGDFRGWWHPKYERRCKN